MFTSKTRFVVFILIFLLIASNGLVVYADGAIKNIDETLDGQNEILYDEIMKNKKDKGSDFDKILNSRDDKDDDVFSLSGVGKSIEHNSIKLALFARKYIVPLTILILLFNTFMITTTGAKSIKNRKKYITSSIFFYIFFLIILNFPIYLLWRYSVDIESTFFFRDFFGFVDSVAKFFKENGFVFSTIVLSYGMVNYISSESNVPKRLASSYMIKMSFVMFALFQILPLIFKLAI